MSPSGKLLAVITLLFSGGALASTPVQQPARAFGYVIGDMLEQRIRLQANGKAVELAQLPVLQRVGQWLQRRAAYRVEDSQQRSWLVLKYQVINSPSEPIVAGLPAVDLELSEEVKLSVDAWPISISPLTPANLTAIELLPPMRPDYAAQAPDTQLASWRLQMLSLLLAFSLLSWSGWWLWRRHIDIERLPFARAFYQIGKLEADQLNENPDAWLILHRAFDAAAGRSIHLSAVSELIRRQTWLSSQQARIEEFYSASATRFFQQSEQPQAFELAEFCRLLYLAEKRFSGKETPAAGKL